MISRNHRRATLLTLAGLGIAVGGCKGGATATDGGTQDTDEMTSGDLPSDGPDGGGPDLDVPTPDATDSDAPSPDLPPLTPEEEAILALRPYEVFVPSGYTGEPVPLVMALHGYSGTGEAMVAYLDMRAIAEARTFIVVAPDGALDSGGSHYWNATDVCCAGDEPMPPDDVAYLTAVINDIRLRQHVDDRRIYIIGHSNGGFMAHRMACDRSSRIAAIVSIAGAQWNDVSNCRPTEPVSVAQVHGTEDTIIEYDGARDGYPGAVTTVAHWAGLDGCDPALAEGGFLDLDTTLGEDTVREASGCSPPIGVELWSIVVGGSHGPSFSSQGVHAMYDFLLSHPKP